jgi:basic membrane protein A and related proteins
MSISRRNFLTFTAAGAAFVGSESFGPFFGRRAAAAGPVGIGILFPGTTKDRGWMQSGYEGVQAAKAAHQGDISVSFVENTAMSDYEQALTSLAGKSKLVIAAGGQCQADTEKVAGRFPNVNFVVIGGAREDTLRPNVAIYDVRQAEVAYLAGAAAAMLTKSGTVSFIGGLEIPPIVNAATEFGNGAKSINPSIKYVQAMTGDFDDVAKAKEAALAAAAGGADIHYAALTLGMRGLEQAISEKGGHIIGSYSDKCGADARYIAFTITGVGFMMETAISETLAGTWKPDKFRGFGLKAGHKASGIVVCSATPEIKAKLDQIERDLIGGKIKTLDA